MKTGCANIVPIPVREKSARESALGRDVDYLIDVFRELREIEAMTGRAGFASRMIVCITSILISADKLAQEEMSRGKSSGRVRP